MRSPSGGVNLIEARCRSRYWTLAVATLAVLCLAAPSSGQRGASLRGPALHDRRPWFEPGADSYPVAGIRRGARAAGFNEAEAESLLRSIVKSTPNSDDTGHAHELLSRIYLRSGQYTRLVANLDQWA